MTRNVEENIASDPRLVVATFKSASWRTRHGAKEFARYASKILGEKIPLTDSIRDIEGRDLVVVGRPDIETEIAPYMNEAGISFPEKDMDDEGFLIKSFRCHGAKALLIAGKTGLGTLYGVYHYLEAFCKVGFFWSAEQVPKLEHLPMEGISIVENPRFAERFMSSPGSYTFGEYWTWREWKREIEYRIKKKHNLIGLHLGTNIVWKEVLGRHGLSSKALSKAEIYRDRLTKRITNYARKLGLKLITPAFMGDVPPEFAAANPQVRYIEIKKWDLNPPKNTFMYPSDPMFRILGEEFLRAYTKRYGTDHYYFVPPYPEAYAGGTPEEKRSIKLDFVKAVQEYMTAADPEWRWLADSWTFFTTKFWSHDEIKSFCMATDPERFRIYDTWGEERPLYRINNYFYGRSWSLGILHCFGGNTSLRGDLQGLIDSVKSVAHDPRANRCIGIYLVPEAAHHNDLYYDLAMSLWWSPDRVTLDKFLEDYAERRYGHASAPRMAHVLGRLARTIYSDNDPTQPLFLVRLSSGFDTPNTEHYVPPIQAKYALEVGDAISLSLQEAKNQRANRLYWRDLVDMARRYYGDIFNQWISKLYYAFDSGDKEAFQRYRTRVEQCLDSIQDILWSWKDYSLESIFDRLRSTPAFDPAQEKATRDMLSLWTFETSLLDYVRRDDLAEIFTNYYLKRINAYMDHLADRLGLGQQGMDNEFLKSVYRKSGDRWIEGPWEEPIVKFRENPIGAIKAAFSHCNANADELLPKVSKELTNPGFEQGLTGWHATGRRLDASVKKDGGPNGSPALVFKGRKQTLLRHFTLWQDLDARDDLVLELDWKLKAFGPSSRAGLRVEVFDSSLRKKAELTYQFGDGGDYWPDYPRPDNATPEWRIGVDPRPYWWTGFHTVKNRVGNELNIWKHLTARPREDLDRVHGKGTWTRLDPDLLRISLIVSSRLAEDPIEGSFSNLHLSRSVSDIRTN